MVLMCLVCKWHSLSRPRDFFRHKQEHRTWKTSLDLFSKTIFLSNILVSYEQLNLICVLNVLRCDPVHVLTLARAVLTVIIFLLLLHRVKILQIYPFFINSGCLKSIVLLWWRQDQTVFNLPNSGILYLLYWVGFVPFSAP